MTAEIYYFSGTGNSFTVAKDIAKELNGKTIPIASVITHDTINPDSDVVGIVFPVYNAVVQGMPVMVKTFAGKLEGLDSKYVFAICTCLGWSHLTLQKFDRIIKKKGGELSAGFTVIMPDNSNPVSKSKQQKLFKNWEKKKEKITQYVNCKRKGRFENPILLNFLMIPFLSNGKKKTLTLYRNLSKDNFLSYEEAVNFSDRSFVVNDKCNACGVCADICPANDIQIVDCKPVWQNHCESCLACVNWCPQQAITGGIVSVNKTPTGYHHPDVKISNLILR